MSSEMDYVDALTELRRRWRRHNDRFFMTGPDGGDVEDGLHDMYQDTHQYVQSPQKLLQWYKDFREWFARHQPGVPRWVHFLGYLSRRVREEREETENRLINDCPLCEGSRWMDMLLPRREEGEGLEPDPDHYTPGQPLEGDANRRVYLMAVECVCTDVDPAPYTRMRKEHARWYRQALSGEWSLHPGHIIRPPRAVHMYQRRVVDDDWEVKRNG